jgi:hypothetical protein
MLSGEAAALGAAVAPFLLALAEWGLLRLSRRSARAGSVTPRAWPVRRVAASVGLVIVSLAAFAVSLLVLLSALVWLPWPKKPGAPRCAARPVWFMSIAANRQRMISDSPRTLP